MKDLDWTGTWSQGITELAILLEEIDNQTLRMVVQLSLGGEQLCARLSNMFGHDSVSIDAGHVALAGDDGTLIPGTGQPLLFSGQPTVIIPAKGEVASDSVDLATLAGTSLAVSLYFPQPTKLFTGNFPGIPIYRCQGSAADGKEQPFVPVAIREVVPGRTIPPTAPFLAGVDIVSTSGTGAVVAFGDSITVAGWPAMLAERLQAAGNSSLGMLNQGIRGNRILHDSSETSGIFGSAGVKRFTHDALDQPGVQYVLVLEGINDLVHPGFGAPVEEEVSAEEIISGLQSYVREAHARNVTILGGTILPFEGNMYWTPEREAKRQTVNAWIRSSGVFDGAFDADLATRDPDRPTWLLPSYDSGDQLHPNMDGLQAIAASFDLTLFDRAQNTKATTQTCLTQ